MAVKKGFELVHKFLKASGDDNHTTLTFESRGKHEDARLLKYHQSIGEDNFKVVLHAKSADGLGLQFADMMARPIGVHILRTEQENRAWTIIDSKMCEAPCIISE